GGGAKAGRAAAGRSGSGAGAGSGVVVRGIDARRTAAKRETRATRQPGPGGTAAPEGVKPVGWGVAAGTAVAITGPVLGAAGGDAAAVDGARAAASRAGADAVWGCWGLACGQAVATDGPGPGGA